MSDSASHEAASASTDAPLFSAVEIEQFEADDVTAGSAIGKMLSALFLYTIVAMGIASWWTYSSIQADKGYAADSARSSEAGTHEHGNEKTDHEGSPGH